MGESFGKDRRVLWSRKEGTLVEWLENSAGFGIGEEVLVRMKTTIEDQKRHGACLNKGGRQVKVIKVKVEELRAPVGQ